MIVSFLRVPSLVAAVTNAHGLMFPVDDMINVDLSVGRSQEDYACRGFRRLYLYNR